MQGRASHNAAEVSVDPPRNEGPQLLLDLSAIDLNARAAGRAEIAKLNPHRGVMALLDSIIWCNDDRSQGVGIKHVRADEFWAAGHFPGKPIYPGVLMVESGAQLACYLYQLRRQVSDIVVFLRIEQASFRSMVQPGHDLILLCREVKFGRRRFVCDLQGVVIEQGVERLAFDARISGMTLEQSAGGASPPDA